MGTLSLKNRMSSGWWFKNTKVICDCEIRNAIYGKIELMFQTTNMFGWIFEICWAKQIIHVNCFLSLKKPSHQLMFQTTNRRHFRNLPSSSLQGWNNDDDRSPEQRGQPATNQIHRLPWMKTSSPSNKKTLKNLWFDRLITSTIWAIS